MRGERASDPRRAGVRLTAPLLTGVVVGALGGLLGGCTAGDLPRTTTDPATVSTSGSETPTAEPSGGADAGRLTPSVMIGSDIRTPSRLVRTGVKDPATVVSTRAGWVVQGTDGTTYAVEGGATREIGTTDSAGGLRLLVDGTGSLVGWVERTAAETVVHLYDAATGERLSDVVVAGPRVALDAGAVYEQRGTRLVRHPVDASASTTVALGLPRTARLRQVSGSRAALAVGGRTLLVDLTGASFGDLAVRRVLPGRLLLSPTGRWTVTARGATRVRSVERGRDATPTLPQGTSDPLWISDTAFTVLTASAPLISPPDSVVFHVEQCDVVTGDCENVVSVVTGAALSVPGLRVDAAYPG